MKLNKVIIPLIFCASLLGMVSCANEGSSPFISHISSESIGEMIEISFELGGGTFEMDSILIKKGTALNLNISPEKKDHEFVGWYYDQEYKDPYNNEILYEDTILYAKYEKSIVYEEIKTIEDFLSMKLDGNYILIEDLDFNGMYLNPFGCYEQPYKGVFNGNNHVIKNFKLNLQKYNSLFGFVEGTIKNLNISNDIEVNANDTLYCGLIAGYLYKGTIEKCSSTGLIRVNNEHALLSSYCGGIVARNESGIIRECSSSVLISNNSFASAYSGSICAYSGGGESGSALIENCFANEGTISSVSTSNEGSAYSGGIVGFNFGLVNKCFTTNLEVLSRTGYYHCFGGGIVADNNGGRIENCFSASKVETTSEKGDTFRGGVVGRNFRASQIEGSGTTKNCFIYEGQQITYSTNSKDGDIKNRHHQVCLPQVSLQELKTAEWYKTVLGLDSPFLIKNNYFPSLNSSFKKVNLSEIEGTAANPILIESVDDLLSIDNKKSYKLMKDLTISSDSFKAIGTYDNPFYGTFDGNNHKITFSNISCVNDNGYNSLFGYCNGIIKNLSISYNINLINNTDRATYISSCVAYLVKGYVENCSSVVKMDVESISSILGGLVAYNEEGIITKSFCEGEIISNAKNNSNYVGGLLGVNYLGNIQEVYSSVRINILGVKKTIVGGLVAKNTSLISDAYSLCEIQYVRAEKNYIGGLVGINEDRGKIINTYAKSVFIEGEIKENFVLLGGLTGSNEKEIINSYYLSNIDIYSSGHSPVFTDVKKINEEELASLALLLSDKFYDDSYPHLNFQKEN